MKIHKILSEIQATSGTNQKKAILKENLSPTLVQIFHDTYGEQKYFIKKFNCPTNSGDYTIDKNYIVFHRMLNKLANREVTGDLAADALFCTVALFNKTDQEILCKIIDRNLKIGISLDNFLSVIGEKSSKFEVALAETLSKAKGINPLDGSYFISRKLDGVRCLCFIHNTKSSVEVKFVSRQNKQILTLGELIKPISGLAYNIPLGDWVLDGEVCIVDENGNENFKGLMSQISRKNYTVPRPLYHIFDILRLSDFTGDTISEPFSKRYKLLLNISTTYTSPNLKVLKQTRVVNQRVLDRWVKRSQKHNWEGCMLRKDAPYKSGRSKDLLKIKYMLDDEYVVQDVEMGTATYNEGGSKVFKVASALLIKHKGNTVRVGSGISKYQRLRWYKHPEEIIGKTITVQYFEETKDSKTGATSLRFPVLKHVYEDGRHL